MTFFIDHPNPRDHLHTEWLLTNGLGGYAMGTVLGINTRRYHGLLVASLKPPVERVVALHSMIEQLVIPREDGSEEVIDLSTQMFVGPPPDGEPMLHPEGWRHLRSFHCDDRACVWVYNVRGIEVRRRVAPNRNDLENDLSIQYEVRAAAGSRDGTAKAERAWLRLRPLVPLRDFHQLGDGRAHDVSIDSDRRLVRIGEQLELRHHGGALFRESPQVWRRFALIEERARGQAWVEDVWSPGEFRLDCGNLVSGGTCLIEAIVPTSANASPPRVAFPKSDAGIEAAAIGFLVTRPGATGAGRSIIAGYPWFADWGRDAMIALPGLLLTTGRLDEARDVLLTFARHMKHGLIPNRFDDAGGEPHYNTVDASLWFVHAVWCWWRAVIEATNGGAGVLACDRSHRLNGGESDATPPAPNDHGASPPAANTNGVTERLTIRRRRLPHWEAGGHAYFVTFDLKEGTLNPEERQVVADAVRHWHGTRLHLYVAVVMPDHVHMLIQPLEKDEGTWWSLSELLHSIKGFTSHQIQKARGASGPLWQAKSYDRIVRDEKEFWEKWWYIESNPMRAGLVDRPEDYPYTIRGVDTADEAVEASSAVAGGTPAPPTPPPSQARTPAPPPPAPPALAIDAELLAACRAIIHAYRAGIRFEDPRAGHHGSRINIGVTRDGLVSAGDETTQLTWMDAARDGVIFTPRHGLAVEVNALWHHAIRCLADMVETDPEREDLIEYAGQIAIAFQMHFWWGEKACLHDVLSLRPPRQPAPEYVPDGSYRFPGPADSGSRQPSAVSRPQETDSRTPTTDDQNPLVWTPDGKLRPNQIFAASLPYSALTRDQQRLVVECVRRRFLTPYGLRTLDRADPDYHPRYEGSLFERDAAYHNGAVWPWLIGPYGEAVLRVNDFSDKAKREVRALLQPLLDETARTTGAACLGQIAEVYDGDEPHRPSGCPAQAWSVAEVLRLLAMVEPA